MNLLRVCFLGLGCACWLASLELLADEPPPPTPVPAARALVSYKSNNLHVRTDLAQGEADALCARLERTLQFAARYWGREPRGQIDCYVVDDLNNWTDAELPHRLARVIIFGVGGATVPRSVGTGKRTRNEPAIYASSRPGVAEHELIHAYCAQTFGSGGPEWYKEGMAEMASRGSTRATGILCSQKHFVALRRASQRTVNDVLTVGTTGIKLSAALKSMLEDPAHHGRHVSLTAWTQRDTDNVAAARDEYLRSWALCYMLLHNPNYSKRFRAAGGLLVNSQHGGFDNLFEPVHQQVGFEYKFLLDHFASGYRVDLCRWDWHARFQPLDACATHRTRVAAARGFQASGVELVAGRHYSCEAEGQWTTNTGGLTIDADGHADESGRLVGIVMNGFELGQPFPLGRDSSFRAATNGRLYLRCNDAWNELGDNGGQVIVKVTMR